MKVPSVTSSIQVRLRPKLMYTDVHVSMDPKRDNFIMITEDPSIMYWIVSSENKLTIRWLERP